MKKKNQRNALQLLEVFQKRVLQHKPDREEMISEIHMMRFKIKPLQGDFSDVDFGNREFIEILWSLGKLDEFFQKQYSGLEEEDRKTFYTYFDSIQKKLQDDLNRLNFKQDVKSGKSHVLEMEIFKERQRRKKTN